MRFLANLVRALVASGLNPTDAADRIRRAVAQEGCSG